MKTMSSPVFSDNGNSITLYAGCQASSACPDYSWRHKCGSIFYPMLRHFLKKCCLEYSQAWPIYTSGNSNMQMQHL